MLEGTMPTPAELREASRRARALAQGETSPDLKRLMVSHSLALACLAEKIEREDVARAEPQFG
jgi:hypothetical protein